MPQQIAVLFQHSLLADGIISQLREYSHLFSVLCIVNITSIIIWLTVRPLQKLFGRLPNRIDQESQTDSFQLSKIDLALMAIAALTIYMAYRSRRFIPIAAIAACPIVAMFIDQMSRTISAARNFHKRNYLAVPPMPYNLRMFFTVAAAVAVLFFGVCWSGQRNLSRYWRRLNSGFRMRAALPMNRTKTNWPCRRT